ncbi:MAG: hypothetical protein P1U82_24165 [Verrucomicrobiales bacterium]|nr:hypothetical protein [Verrucomicrobiales bacterium]
MAELTSIVAQIAPEKGAEEAAIQRALELWKLCRDALIPNYVHLHVKLTKEFDRLAQESKDDPPRVPLDRFLSIPRNSKGKPSAGSKSDIRRTRFKEFLKWKLERSGARNKKEDVDREMKKFRRGVPTSERTLVILFEVWISEHFQKRKK